MEAESRNSRLADTPQKPEPRNFVFCINCGCKLPQEARYCLYCGTPVQRELFPDKRRENKKQQPPASRKKKSSPLLVILLILALLVIFIDVYILCTRFASKTSENKETWSFLPDPSDSTETASAVQNSAEAPVPDESDDTYTWEESPEDRPDTENSAEASESPDSENAMNPSELSQSITIKPEALNCLWNNYGQLKAQYPEVEPQFVNNGRYYVQILGTEITVWFQNDSWTPSPYDSCKGVCGTLDSLLDNMPPQISLAAFTERFEALGSSDYYYENSFQIEDSPGTAYYISAVHFAKVFFNVFPKNTEQDGGGLGGLLEIDLDAVDDLGGETIVDSSFFGRASILAG